MTMLFGGGSKTSAAPNKYLKSAAPAPAKPAAKPAAAVKKVTAVAKPAASRAGAYKINEGTANKGTYIPEGLTKAAYDKFLAEEAKKKAAIKKRFPKGKEPETLTEWMLNEAKKGNSGPDLLTKGHRMVKAKYDGWYIDKVSFSLLVVYSCACAVSCLCLCLCLRLCLTLSFRLFPIFNAIHTDTYTYIHSKTNIRTQIYTHKCILTHTHTHTQNPQLGGR